MLKRCPTCGSEKWENVNHREYKRVWKGVVVTLENFKYGKCHSCGERAYPAAQVRRLEEAAAAIKDLNQQ